MTRLDATRTFTRQGTGRTWLLGMAVLAGGMLAGVTAASAQLAFSPDCRAFQQIQVMPPQNALLLSKHPVPHPAGTATVFAITVTCSPDCPRL